MNNDRLLRQIEFVVEIDRLKNVFRRSYLVGAHRNENDAEHSWHLAVMAMILSEYSNVAVDILKVLKMVLIHDLVEIEADDTFCYDTEGMVGKYEREKAAAEVTFGLLPDDLKGDCIKLWNEFDAAQTPEAKFANALDHLMPLLHNYYTGGKTWKEHGIKKDQVVDKNQCIADGAQPLWEFARTLIDKAVAEGFLAE